MTLLETGQVLLEWSVRLLEKILYLFSNIIPYKHKTGMIKSMVNLIYLFFGEINLPLIEGKLIYLQ